MHLLKGRAHAGLKVFDHFRRIKHGNKGPMRRTGERSGGAGGSPMTLGPLDLNKNLKTYSKQKSGKYISHNNTCSIVTEVTLSHRSIKFPSFTVVTYNFNPRESEKTLRLRPTTIQESSDAFDRRKQKLLKMIPLLEISDCGAEIMGSAVTDSSSSSAFSINSASTFSSFDGHL